MSPLNPEFQQTAPASYRGRFAPSPTGPLHLGSLFTALASYLQARSCGGYWHVRIDDVDQTRSVPGAADRILRSLEAFGLEWDGGISVQTQHDHAYEAALGALIDLGAIYRCDCSRTDIARIAGNSNVYPGSCRLKPVPPDQPHALRIRVGDEAVSLSDALQGTYEQNLRTEIGDFVVKRRDGLFAYHLATVVDDAELGVTDVMRGVDLLASTPRQIYLQRCLGLPTPRYAHLPVLVDGQGHKLSKQTGAMAIDERQAPAILYAVLGLLRQKPPKELAGAEVEQLLSWAVPNWNVGPLKQVQTIRIDRFL